MDPAALAARLREIPDFPSPGVRFTDITPLIATADGLAAAVDALLSVTGMSPGDVDIVIGLEARGFIVGAPLALALGAGFVPIRKSGKLPGAVLEVSYDLEYGSQQLAVHTDAFAPGARILVVDDVLATGGTMAAAAELVARLEGRLVMALVLVELIDLGGRTRLRAAGIDPVAVLSLSSQGTEDAQ